MRRLGYWSFDINWPFRFDDVFYCYFCMKLFFGMLQHSGLNGLLNFMQPFTNRKYPELRTIEIGTVFDLDNIRNFEFQHFSIDVIPIFAAQVSLALTAFYTCAKPLQII